MLKPKQNNGMFTTYQLVQDFGTIHCNFSQTNPRNPSGAVPRVAIVQNSSTKVPKMTVFRHGAFHILVVSQLHISDPGTREKRVIGGSRERPSLKTGIV